MAFQVGGTVCARHGAWRSNSNSRTYIFSLGEYEECGQVLRLVGRTTWWRILCRSQWALAALTAGYLGKEETILRQGPTPDPSDIYKQKPFQSYTGTSISFLKTWRCLRSGGKTGPRPWLNIYDMLCYVCNLDLIRGLLDCIIKYKEHVTRWGLIFI